MVKVSEITDRVSLKSWLLDRPEDETKVFAITIAYRAAMRVLPAYWAWVETSGFAKERDLTALPVLRCSLISGVARKMPTPEIKIASTVAAELATATAASSEFASVAAADSAFASVAAAESAASPAAESAASSVTASTVADSAAAVLWKQIWNDCEALQNKYTLLAIPLWNGDENPFQKDWDAVRQSLPIVSPARPEETARGAVPVDWSFWIKWYRDALEGREPDWEMLEEIALIPDEDWEKGPEHINNQVIAGIVEKYAKKEKADTSIPDTTTPSGAEKKSISQKVAANREALALSIAGVLEQIKEYRERIRKLNSLEPEYKEGLLDFLDRLSKQLSDLLGELPDEGEVVSEEKSAKLVLWWREYKVMFGGKAKAYITPDNIAEATVPAGIILGCTGIGAIFGPVGATAGGVVGSLITGQIKPGKAAGELMKDLGAPDSGA